MPRVLLPALLLASALHAQGTDPAIPAMGARVTRVRFFEGPTTPPTLRDRQYVTRFDSAAVRSIYVELGLSYPPLTAAASVRIGCGFTGPDGAPAGTAVVQVQADQGWELSVHAGGTGTDAPGGWKAGTYTVDCRLGTRVIATGSFEISRPAATVAAAPAKPPAKPAPKPVEKPAEKPVALMGGLKGKVTAVKLFESGGEVPDPKRRIVTTTFDALTTRYINLELELEYPKAARRTEFEIPCRIAGPDSVARVPVIKAIIEPGWTGSYHTAGWGARDRGMWPEGEYQVSCRDQGQVVATAAFKVVRGTAAVGPLGASLTHIRFFQSLSDRLPVESRLYGARFDTRSARWIKTEFGLVYQPVPAPTPFTIECIYTFPDGTLRPARMERRVPAGWTGSVHAQGLGWDQPGSWPPGWYKVSCRSEAREFAAGSFEVFDGGAAVAYTAGASLRFFGRKSGDTAPPSYTEAFETGAFDTLYAEASVPLRVSGDSTAYRCTLSDPAGISSAFSIDAAPKDRALVGAGRLSPLDAPRARGVYRAECRIGQRALVADHFEITGKPDLPAADARVVSSALYEGTDLPPDDEAVPDVTFSAAKLRSLWLVALLDHPSDRGAGALPYSCRLTSAKKVVLSDSGPGTITLAPGDRVVVLRQRLVPAPKQKWAPGRLTLTCASGTATFLTQTVDLTR